MHRKLAENFRQAACLLVGLLLIILPVSGPVLAQVPSANAPRQAPVAQPIAPLPAPTQVIQPVSGTQAAPAAPITLSDGYVLGVGDVIDVALVGPGDYQARVQVQTDGAVSLPYIGSIQVKDKTVLQVRDIISRKLLEGGFYKDPVVAVTVASYASRYVVVLGQVGSPGIVPVDRAYRLSELLARVGGARETGADVVTVRRATGEEVSLSIERVAIGGADADPIINPGDKVYVGPAPTFYIYGQVRSAGNFRVMPGMTVRMALGQSGGLTDRGSEKKIKVFRGGKEIRADLSTQIQGGDVVVVGERFF